MAIALGVRRGPTVRPVAEQPRETSSCTGRSHSYTPFPDIEIFHVITSDVRTSVQTGFYAHGRRAARRDEADDRRTVVRGVSFGGVDLAVGERRPAELLAGLRRG